MTKAPVVLIAGVASFALGALMFAGEKQPAPRTAAAPVAATLETPSPEAAPPDALRRPELLAQAERPAAKADATEAAADLGWIGLMLEGDKEKGIRVSGLFPGGPAAFAGIRAGDVLVKIGATSPESTAKAVEAIEKLAPHKPATVTVKRGGKTIELTVNTGSLIEFHERYVREMYRRDPRDPNFAVRHGISDGDVSVELVRRLFEQNERLDRTLHQVLTEVQQLRAELRAKK